MNLRKPLLQTAQHLAKPVEIQFRMQTADNMELGNRLAPALTRGLPNLLERHRVRSWIALLFAEGAQAAAGNANVRRIDMAVDVEVSNVSVHPLAHDIRHVSESEQIARSIERDAV